MTFHILRRTLISMSSIKHVDASNLSHFPFYSSLSSFSTLVQKSVKPSSEIKNYLITRHQFSPKFASVASSVLMDMENYKQSDIIIDYFKENGLSNAQLEEMLTRKPAVLGSNFSKCIKPKVQKIQELGFSQSEIADLLCSVPTIITINNSVDRIGASILVLRSVLVSYYEVVKLLKVCDWFLANDLERVMVPNIELMKSVGVSLVQIRQLVFSFPRFFLLRPAFLRDCVKVVDEMGLSRESGMYSHGVRTVSSMKPDKWESKLKLLKSMGLSDDDILFVFRRAPHVFAVSERKIMEVTKLLLNLGKMDISFVTRNPELLIYSVTGRLRPRLEIINIMKSKGLLSQHPSVTSICKMCDLSFIRRFLIPYASNIGESAEKYIASRGLLVCSKARRSKMIHP